MGPAVAYDPAMRSLGPLAVVVAGVVAPALLAQTRPHVADPWHGYLVEGRVLDAGGLPLANIVVERTIDHLGTAPYSPGAYREVTNRNGRFRFEEHGLGPSTGRTWYLAARRPGCPDTLATVTLTPATLTPGSTRESDVARGVVLRLPPCP